MQRLLLSIVIVLLLLAGTVEAHGQQRDAERKLLAAFKARADNGDARSQFELGAVFGSGFLGLPKDEIEALKWYRRAAEQNYAPAQNDLGTCYVTGAGVERDEVEAVSWFRKAAAQNYAQAQYNLAICYNKGQGLAKDDLEAAKWFRKAAQQNLAAAQYNLGICYMKGVGVPEDEVEGVKWYRKAAEQNLPEAQLNLGFSYENAQGQAKDDVEAAKWYRKAAEQNLAAAQFDLAVCYEDGQGVAKDYVESYKWLLLAVAQGVEPAKKLITGLETKMSADQIAEAQKLARSFKPLTAPANVRNYSGLSAAQARPKSSGTGFFITEDGYLVTNEHVAGSRAQVRLVTEAGLITAKVVKVDVANDLALLKAEGKFAVLPLAASRSVKLGDTVATIGFPNIGLQGFAPKLAKGEIASLSGVQDDPRYFQVSLPVQPGNSGGALVDERGNAVGVVSAKLSVTAALATSGSLPENVNYAVKSSFVLGLLESVPPVFAKLKEPSFKERKFQDVVRSAEEAAVLVLVY